MARNEEKHFARLNRLVLQQQRDEYLKKNPQRPRLDTLTTAEDIKKWLPSIKKDIDFNLKQSQVPCYPESKIQEFSRNIHFLQRQYKSFVQKLREVDPGSDTVPWTDRAYSSKHRATRDLTEAVASIPDKKARLENTEKDENGDPESATDLKPVSVTRTEIGEPHSETASESHSDQPTDFTPISAPILDSNDWYRSLYGHTLPPPIILNANSAFEDKPLEFRTTESNSYSSGGESKEDSATTVEDISRKVCGNRSPDCGEDSLHDPGGMKDTKCRNVLNENDKNPASRTGACEMNRTPEPGYRTVQNSCGVGIIEDKDQKRHPTCPSSNNENWCRQEKFSRSLASCQHSHTGPDTLMKKDSLLGTNLFCPQSDSTNTQIPDTEICDYSDRKRTTEISQAIDRKTHASLNLPYSDSETDDSS